MDAPRDSMEVNEYAGMPRLRDVASAERPQELLEKHGPTHLTDTQLLAMLLRSGSRGLDVLGLSTRLIREAGSLSGLLKWTAEDFQRYPGIGRVKSLQLITVLEIARRVLIQKAETIQRFNSASTVFQLFQPLAAGLTVEKFWVLCLDSKLALVKRVEVTSGIVNRSLAHPREVFREAIRHGAAAVVCAHNHPSGDPTPSASDVSLTRTLVEAAKIIHIDLIDHIIIGDPTKDPRGCGYYSFSDAGVIG